MAIGKEHLKQIIAENNITDVDDIYSLLKDSFKDILQELLEIVIINAMATLPKQLKANLLIMKKTMSYLIAREVKLLKNW